jgi:hypothetical protein
MAPQKEVRTDFETDDPIIEAMIKECARIWYEAGVLIAGAVTVNAGAKNAVPITRAPRASLHAKCNMKSTYMGDGCVAKDGGSYVAMFLPVELDDLDRLKTVLMHELGHILSGEEGHHDEVGVMHYNGTSATPTEADMVYMRKYTACVSPEEIREMEGLG